MSLLKQPRITYDIITQADSYPYIPEVQLVGIEAVNDGADTVTIVIDDGSKDITINITTNARTYSGYFQAIKSINVTAGTTFQIELRGT